MMTKDYDYGTVVYFGQFPDVDDALIVRCAWCDDRDGWWTDAYSLDDANNAKLDHENEHGIFMDPDTGAMWYDPSENVRGGGSE